MAKSGKKRIDLGKKKDLAASLAVSKFSRKEIAKRVGKSYSTINKWFLNEEFLAIIVQKTEQLEQKTAEEMVKKTDILQKLIDIIEFDPGDYYDDSGNILSVKNMSKMARKMLAEINNRSVTMESADGSQMKNVEIEKIKWQGLMDAIKEINRMMPGFLAPSRNENTGKGGGPIKVENVTQYTPEQIETMQQVGKAIVERLK